MPRGDRARGQPDGLRDRQPKREERGKRGAFIDPPGYDAGKKINGKKRHILVDTVGLLLHAVVHPADIQSLPRRRPGTATVVSWSWRHYSPWIHSC